MRPLASHAGRVALGAELPLRRRAPVLQIEVLHDDVSPAPVESVERRELRDRGCWGPHPFPMFWQHRLPSLGPLSPNEGIELHASLGKGEIGEQAPITEKSPEILIEEPRELGVETSLLDP